MLSLTVFIRWIELIPVGKENMGQRISPVGKLSFKRIA